MTEARIQTFIRTAGSCENSRQSGYSTTRQLNYVFREERGRYDQPRLGSLRCDLRKPFGFQLPPRATVRFFQ